jgi:hypothetical protein
MNTQFQMALGATSHLPTTRVSRPTAEPGKVHRIASDRALHLGRLGGDLTVIEGRIWLTRDGDLGDHFVERGEKVRLEVNENAVIESADSKRTVIVRWNPRRQSFVGAVLAEPLRGLAFLAARAADGFAALARKAASSAKRAQGCICGGDSIASSGTLK